MRIFLLTLLIAVSLLAGPALHAQPDDPEIRLALQLDSLGTSNRLSRHFARIYTETVLSSLQHYNTAGAREKEFIHRFETAFAGLFFRADSTQGKVPGAEAWFTYYSDSNRSQLQFQLLGINAHINADLSVALIRSFSLDELRIYRKDFLRFQQELRRQFYRFYADNIGSTRMTKALGLVPLGLSRSIGSTMMGKWRKRQYRIAITHYSDPDKSAKLQRKTARAKERTDRLILRYL